MGRRSRSVSRSRGRRRSRDDSHSRSHSRSRSYSRSPSCSRGRGRGRSRGGNGRSSRSRYSDSHHSSSSSSFKQQQQEEEEKKKKKTIEREIQVDNSTGNGSVKAKVVEKNGEISCSIEETNRLRAALGLKPLSLDKKKKQENLQDLRKTKEEIEQEKERELIRQALEKSKKKRQLHQELQGNSLGEMLLQEKNTARNPLEWVKKTRLHTKERQKALERVKDLQGGSHQQQQASASYSSSDLAGMTIGHEVDAFQQGQEVILTLKDTSILNEKGQDISEVQDELVNVEIDQEERRQLNQQRTKRAFQPAYTGFEEDDEEALIVVGKDRKKQKRLLAQYDTEEDLLEARKQKAFQLNEMGQMEVNDIELTSRTNTRKNLYLDEGDVQVFSLAMNKQQEMQEYYTQEEMDAQLFNKSKKKKSKQKSKKKRRQQQEEEEQQPQENLLEQLEAEASAMNGISTSSTSSDRGSRRRRNRTNQLEDQANVLEEMEEKSLLRFEQARQQANQKAAQALAKNQQNKQKIKRFEAEEEQVDLELNTSLAMSRRLQVYKTSEEQLAALAASVIKHTKEPTPKMDVDEKDGSGVVVFNEATDFQTRLRNAMEERKQQSMTTTTKTTTSSSTTISVEVNDSDEEMKEEAEETNEDIVMKDTEQKEEEEEEEEEKNETWGEEQPLVGTGMAATLALLKRTGELKPDIGSERQAGRANDARDRNATEELRIKEGVKLDYRDEFGRLLTKKEAFRQLSYRFHGHQPGKKKKEKRLKQLKEELLTQKKLSGEASTKRMKTLEIRQKATKQAHVVLNRS